VVAVTVTLLINTLFAVWLARCKVRGFLTVFSAPVLRPGFVFVFDVDQFDEEFGAHLYIHAARIARRVQLTHHPIAASCPTAAMVPFADQEFI
jgi:hypothetical protein